MKYIEALCLSVVALFAPIHSIIAAAAFLIIVDLITGIIAAKKRNDPITSAGLRRTITKFLVYEVALIVGFVAEKYLLGDSLPVSKLIGILIASAELKSIYENLDKTNDEQLLKSVIGKLGSPNDTK